MWRMDENNKWIIEDQCVGKKQAAEHLSSDLEDTCTRKVTGNFVFRWQIL